MTMADKETKQDAKEEGNRPGRPDSDDIRLPEPMVHRESYSPMTKEGK
jgi:hypothetical protein